MPVTFSRVHLVRKLGSFRDAHLEYWANKGIGFEVARQLAASGCTVLVGARNKARCDEAAAKLKSEGGEVGHLEIDLGDSATIASAAQAIDADLGHLDILLSNTGIVALGDLRVAVLMQSSGFRVNFLGRVAATWVHDGSPLLVSDPSPLDTFTMFADGALSNSASMA